MGIYVYKRTSQILRIHTEEGFVIQANVYRFAFKPYWDEWHMAQRGPSREFMSPMTRRLVGYYRRFLTTSENRYERMKEHGQLSNFAVILGDKTEHNEGATLCVEKRKGPYMYDDTWGDPKYTTVIGTIHKAKGRWVLRENKEKVA